MSDKADITFDEWIAALDAIEKKTENGEGLSTRELAEGWGVTLTTAARRIRSLHDAGRIMAARRFMEGVSGTYYPVPVYRLKGKAK